MPTERIDKVSVYASHVSEDHEEETRRQLQALYRHILGRDPDEEGFRSYSEILAGGSSIAEACLTIATSPEASQRYLESGGLAAALRDLLSTLGPDEGLQAILAALARYGRLAGIKPNELLQTPLPPDGIVGRLELGSEGSATGWAVNLNNPLEPVVLRLQVAGVEHLIKLSANSIIESEGVPLGERGEGVRPLYPGIFIRSQLEVSISASAKALEPFRGYFAEILDRGNLDVALNVETPLATHTRSKYGEISDYMEYVLYKTRGDNCALPTVEDRAGFVRWYMNDYRESLSELQPFVCSPKVERYMKEPAFSEGVTPYYVSRLLLDFWRRHFNDKNMLFSRDEYNRLVYKLASSPNAGRSSFLRCFGEEMLRVLRQRDPVSRHLPFATNRYWAFALQDELGSEKLANLSYEMYLAEVFKKTFYSLATGLHLSLLPNEWLIELRRALSGGVSLGESLLVQVMGAAGAPQRWLDEAFYEHHPQFKILSTRHVPGVSTHNVEDIVRDMIRPRQSSRSQFKLYVVGHTNQTGLGANLRMSVETLRHAGVEPVVLSVDRKQQDVISAIDVGTTLDRPVLLFHVNADRLPEEMARLPASLLNGAYKIGFFLWETSVPPKSHLLGLDIVDEVWVPSDYIKEVYEKYTDTPVVNIKKAIHPPATIAQVERNRLGVSQQDFVFLTIADFHSSIPRKNPLSVVCAFKEAFPNSESVKLILKIRNIEYDHWSNRGKYWERVEEEIAQDSRIVVLEEDLTYSEYWGLFGSIDCFVSLHKSEGFGYGLAHAMLMERPVIATDYSGSRDFCTGSTCFLVPAKEVLVNEHEMPVNVPGAAWAEPDIRAAAACMKKAVENPDLAAEKVKNAKDVMERIYSLSAHSDRYFRQFHRFIPQ